MTFQDFLAQIQTLRIEESRAQTGEYFEAVIAREGLESLHKILTAYFGPPLKPEGRLPSWTARRHSRPYGGIRKEQTMYFRRRENICECALLWPWGSGARITIKVSQAKSPSRGTGLLRFLARLFGRK